MFGVLIFQVPSGLATNLYNAKNYANIDALPEQECDYDPEYENALTVISGVGVYENMAMGPMNGTSKTKF